MHGACRRRLFRRDGALRADRLARPLHSPRRGCRGIPAAARRGALSAAAVRTPAARPGRSRHPAQALERASCEPARHVAGEVLRVECQTLLSAVLMGRSGFSASSPAVMLHVAAARPRIVANGRNRPPTAISRSCAPVTHPREHDPSRTGSNAPSSAGGGTGAAGARDLEQAVLALGDPASPARASRSARPDQRARFRSPAGPCPRRKRRASSASAASRSTRGCSPSQSRTSTYCWLHPAIGPRTMSPRSEASISSWISAWPSAGTRAARFRSPSCSRVSGPAELSERTIAFSACSA